MHTGKIIKFLRQEANMTQGELSNILGVNISSIQKYESNSVQNLKMSTIRKLCEHFKVLPWVFVFPEALKDLNNLSKLKFKKCINDKVDPTLALNEEGLAKIVEYTRDLIESGNYLASQDKVKMSQDKNDHLDL